MDDLIVAGGRPELATETWELLRVGHRRSGRVVQTVAWFRITVAGPSLQVPLVRHRLFGSPGRLAGPVEVQTYANGRSARSAFRDGRKM